MTVLNAVTSRTRRDRLLLAFSNLSARTVLMVGQVLPAFFLSFADLMGMPSGLNIALLAALGANGAAQGHVLVGSLFGMLLRLLWGVAPHRELLVSMAAVLPMSRFLSGRGNGWMLGAVGVALLPLGAVAVLTGTAQDALLAVGAMAVAMLSTPVMFRGIQALRRGRPMNCLEERLAVGYLAALVVSGGGSILVFGVDVGGMLAAGRVCLMSLCLGVAAGMMSGLVGGVMLAMQGVPAEVSVALGIGGFLAGMAQQMGRRWVTCCAFALGAALVLLVSGSYGFGCLAGVGAAALLTALLPKLVMEQARELLRRFAPARQVSGDAYAASALARWEKTVEEMAQAVPDPQHPEVVHDGPWWQQHLCCDCPERCSCETMLSALAIQRAGEEWHSRNEPEEEWQEQLEKLRGLGCGRLYCLRAGMDQLRREEKQREIWVKRAVHERDMLVTHLTAMAGAARRYALLAAGASWWDEMSARKVRQVLNETACPASLLYVRRVQEHATAALEVCSPGEALRMQEELARLLSQVLEVKMMVSSVNRDRICFQERPVYQVQVGISGRGGGQEITGDAAYAGEIPGGCFIAVLSDGMGQGMRAGEESAATVRLLRLCMEAGYTRDQALGAVNGMMLLETGGERFATADLLTIDLWSGQANLDKLGAAGSWLLRGTTLAEVTGDALPVGVLETVESRSSLLRLKDGDRVALVTDGVEDAYESRDDLEEAIRGALEEVDPNAAAERLVEEACLAGSSARRDDMTAVVLQLTRCRD